MYLDGNGYELAFTATYSRESINKQADINWFLSCVRVGAHWFAMASLKIDLHSDDRL